MSYRREPFDPGPCLKVFEVSPEYRQMYERDRTGGPVLMIAYCTEDQQVEMGQVARRDKGTYWWYTTNPKIWARHTASVEYSTEKEARDDLLTYVTSEVIRVFNLSQPVFHHDLPDLKFRQSDEQACDLTKSDADSFIAGMDWALRTQGIPRRPAWAKFLVQNRDLSLVWFEEQPTCDHQNGNWVCDQGRTKKVVLDDSILKDVYVWSKSIRRVK